MQVLERCNLSDNEMASTRKNEMSSMTFCLVSSGHPPTRVAGVSRDGALLFLHFICAALENHGHHVLIDLSGDPIDRAWLSAGHA